jgi:peptide/nickel transport system ATP-binding protein
MGKAPPSAGHGDAVASLTDVVVRYPMRGGLLGGVTQNVHAVEHVSFDIRKGETFALVGESGCGKSTIAKAMVGLAPHQGRIEIAGQSLDGRRDGLKACAARCRWCFRTPWPR